MSPIYTQGPTEAPRVLVIEDNAVDREVVRRMLSGSCQVVEAPDFASARRVLARAKVDCALVDFHLPDADGLNVAAQVSRDTPVVFLTGQGDEGVAVAAMKAGAMDYLSKGGLDGEQLRRAIDYAIERDRSRRALDSEREALQDRAVALEQANSNLRRERQQMSMVLHALPALVGIFDDSRVLSWQGGARFDGTLRSRLATEVERAIADRSALGLEYHPLVRAARQSLRQATPARVDLVLADHRLSVWLEPVKESGGGRRVLVLVLDTSEVWRMEQRLGVALKMEAVGRLAATVAHDYNNILTAIVGAASLLRMDLEQAGLDPGDADLILSAASRASALTRQLLTLAPRSSVNRADCDVAAVLYALEPMLRKLLSAGQELLLEVAEGPLRAAIDPLSLERVFTNLVANANAALSGPGRIGISVDLLRDLPRGPAIRVVVTDDGPGMTLEVRSRIFEPFYTTRGDRGGTGIGLSTCWKLVSDAGGEIDVHSLPGRGATFTLTFPLLEDPQEDSE